MTIALPVLSNEPDVAPARSAEPSRSTDPTRAPATDFADWRWQLRHRLSTKDELAALLSLTP